MSSCFGFRKSRSEEREPLLPQYNDDTSLQRTVHQKLHSYQMFRAMSKGYMPSNEQLIVNLRTLLGSDVLSPDTSGLSESGRKLVKYSSAFVDQFIQLLQNKNNKDQIQDFIWFLTKSRISVDTKDLVKRTTKIRAQADTAAAFRSLQTVGSLLLTNSDFRIFLADLQNIGREVFRDSAFAISDAAKKVGETADQGDGINAAENAGEAPSQEDLDDNLKDIGAAIGDGAKQVGKQTKESVSDHFSREEQDTLVSRLKKAILKLRQRNDYSDSVSTIGLLVQRYAQVYSRSADQVIEAVEDDVETNEELDRAVKNFWSLARSFGDSDEWDELENRFHKVSEHRQKDPQFEKFMNEVGDSVQKLLTEPNFIDNADQKVSELRQKYQESGSEGGLRGDVNALLEQLPRTFSSVLQDKDVNNLVATGFRTFSVLNPADMGSNKELFQDSVNIFLPMLIQAIQYIPIPRLEISAPEADILLENLIIEPGTTINGSSFLPFKLRVETYNDLEVRKARMRVVSKVNSLVTIKLDGISVRADEIGFWLRAHSGILRLADEGIASVQLDERGLDIHMDVEIGEERVEKMLTLKDVRVTIHKLKYDLRKSKFSWLAWLVKPLLQPIIRKVAEKQVSNAIGDFFHTANRELVFARERLRATRISDPKDLQTFFKAVTTRLSGPPPDPDLYTRLGVEQPGKGVFKGVYAPGSVVKLWNEEAARAAEVVDDYRQDGWRNDVFEVNTTSA